jgi:hypothetical protein
LGGGEGDYVVGWLVVLGVDAAASVGLCFRSAACRTLAHGYGIRTRHPRSSKKPTRSSQPTPTNTLTLPTPRGFQVLLKGLPPNCHWQDLRAFGAGPRGTLKPVYAGVNSDRITGVIAYNTEREMLEAPRVLNGQRINGHRVEVVLVRADGG